MITHTISVVELVWTISATIGLLYSGKLLHRAVGDLAFLKHERINEYREFSAVTTVWIFTLMTFVNFAFLVIGVMAMTVASPNQHVQPTSYVSGAVFMIVSFVFALFAFVINHRKEVLLDKVRQSL